MTKHFVRQIFFTVLTLLLAACVVSAQQSLQAPQVPEALLVSSAEKVAFAMLGEGVQIYQCKPNQSDATKLEWSFIAPEALLFDDERNELGKHYAGPAWESSDGSKVFGEVKARADAPSGDTIPWLLLNAKSTEGEGTFSGVTSIQRVETTGGQAPKEGCDRVHLNEEARVPYTAVYYFFTAR